MYYLVNALLYLLSLLPWFIIYGLSNVLYILAFHVFGYRKQVVLENLRRAFPEMSDAARLNIARRFYHNFTDTLMETIKIISLSDRAFDRHFSVNEKTMALITGIVKSGRTCQIHAMHNFNWEYVNLGVAKALEIPFLGVYMPLKNKVLERIFRRFRHRYGTILVPATAFKRNFEQVEREYASTNYALALVADQSPGKPNEAWWLNFFGTPTGFIPGPERAARDRKLGVVFAHFYKIRRGLYTFDAVLATEDASTTAPGELTLSYARYVEDCIRKRPDNYLWSHRRWKHAYKPEYADRVLEPLKGIN
jgi:Kdo2-lipid IVA lauroyltransferase/acyltransferase